MDVEEVRSRDEDVENSGLLLRGLDTDLSIAVYSVLIFLTMVVALVRSFVFFTVCMRASVK